MSIARRAFPSRLELKRRAGSFKDAPLAKVSFTTFLYDSPVQMMPSCDQIGVPIHFHSSTTSGSASLMSLRILLRVSPRQSPSSAILFERFSVLKGERHSSMVFGLANISGVFSMPGMTKPCLSA